MSPMTWYLQLIFLGYKELHYGNGTKIKTHDFYQLIEEVYGPEIPVGYITH